MVFNILLYIRYLANARKFIHASDSILLSGKNQFVKYKPFMILDQDGDGAETIKKKKKKLRVKLHFQS